MEMNDKTAFAIEWRKANAMFNREVSPEVCNYAFELLQTFELNDVILGIRRAICTSTFAPTVADVVNAIKAKYKLDEDTLKAQAETVYNGFKYVNSGSDVWVEDARAVIAFKRAFGTLKAYCLHDVKADPFDRKAFVECYIKTPRNSFNPNDPKSHLLEGIYSFSDDPCVMWVGDKDACLRYARAYYKTTGQSPRYPLDSSQMLTMQKRREQLALEDLSSKPVTHEQLERLYKQVEEILNVRLEVK